MNIPQRGVLTLIRSAITGEPLSLPEGFQIEDALVLIKRHQVAGLVYEGAVKCGISPKSDAMQQLFRLYYTGMLRSEKQLRVLEQLFTAFQANEIDHLPLKGSVLKALYPQPGLRPMGDADILIRMEQYEKIRPIMESLGFTEKPSSDHELVWTHPDLYLELHKWMMPSKSPDFFRYFESSWQRAKPENGCRYCLSPEDTFVFLFVHYAKHYRGGGIGLRQLTDLWIFRQANPQLDMVYIRGELDQLKLAAFLDNTQAMLASWFENGPETDKTALMSNFIWNSGSWGDRQTHAIWEGIVSAQKAGSRRGGKVRYLLRSLFPPASVLRFRYPVVLKAPWLVPFLWPVRWVCALLFRRKNLRKYRIDYQAQTDENMDAYQQSLHYVGLDYDF